MSKKIPKPRAVTGYAYVGQWLDGSLGWCGASHVHAIRGRRLPSGTSETWRKYAVNGDIAFLCRVTITPVFDAKRQPITKRQKRDAS